MNNVSGIINRMNIKQRTDGRYEGRITVCGKRKSFYGNTKTEIKNKAKEYLNKIENGYVEPQNVILNDYIEYWLKQYKLNKIEPSSYTRLYRVYYCQIKNDIGKMKIGSITTKDIQTIIDERANPSMDKTKPLAMSGLKRIIHLLKPCMKQAVKDGIISSNPCDDVLLPTESCIKVETKQQFSLNDNEINQLKDACLKKYKTTGEYCSRDAFIILLMINLGLRVGEVLALQWEDVDFEHSIIYINKTVQSNILNLDGKNGENKTYDKIKKSTKTRCGVRILKINDDVRWYLKELDNYDKRNHITSSYISCTRTGTLNTSRNLQRSLDRLIKNTQINKRVTLHTLRHTFGSVLLRNGIGIEVISKLMGHANISITYNKYIHSIQEEEAKAMTMVKVC